MKNSKLSTEFNKFVGLEIKAINDNGCVSLDRNDRVYQDIIKFFNDNSASYRFRMPGQMVTMDHNPDRFNVYVALNEGSGKFKVSRASFG